MQFSYILQFLSLLLLSVCLELYLMWKHLKSLLLNGLIHQFVANKARVEKCSLSWWPSGNLPRVIIRISCFILTLYFLPGTVQRLYMCYLI